MPAAFTLGLAPDGRESLVVVVKGTFLIPPRGGVAPLADVQDDHVYADTFTGEPGFSAVDYEMDFAPVKPRCDVLLIGSAHAPGGRAVTSLPVGLRVGAMSKGFEVVGDRHWTAGVFGVAASNPKPFRRMQLSYDRAFGGRGEVSKDNPALSDAYAANPAGVGYFRRGRDADVFGKPLPNTHATNEPVTSPKGSYRPMSFGPIGRNFAERVSLAGTYDESWRDETFPFLPSDFMDEYYQAAPRDQQVPYPAGGEVVQLLNLTPYEQPPFKLPPVDVPVQFTDVALKYVARNAVLDTIVLRPDEGKMNLVWRASMPLKRNIHEVAQIVVGYMPKGWYRARALGKQYYPSLGALVAGRARG
jgi:hypothetical protein